MNDYISRQAAIEELQGKDPSQIWDTADIEVWINEFPSADIRENVKGEWEVIDSEEPRRYGCTKCKMLCFYPYNFCPNCGSYNGGKTDVT